MTGKPGRIAILLAQLALRLKTIRREDLSLLNLKLRLNLVGRMVKAHFSGQYRVRSLKLLAMLLAVIVYFLNPFDLIPDFILGIGLTDDLAVLAWLYAAAGKEISEYSEWERKQNVIINVEG